MSSEYPYTLRVRYGDTDQMGVAYYANYLYWFEVGRTEFCRAHGSPTPTGRERAFSFPWWNPTAAISILPGTRTRSPSSRKSPR